MGVISSLFARWQSSPPPVEDEAPWLLWKCDHSPWRWWWRRTWKNKQHKKQYFWKKHKGKERRPDWLRRFFISLNCLLVHCRMRWMPRSDTSGHLVPDTKCVQLLKLNDQLPVVYRCLVISNHFPLVKIWWIIQLKQPLMISGSFRFQVPAMIMSDPRLRKHPELFEAKIPTSWVAPELLEAWAADWQKWVKLKGRESFGTKNSDAVYVHI